MSHDMSRLMSQSFLMDPHTISDMNHSDTGSRYTINCRPKVKTAIQ